jgi:hypothetical protein
MPGGAQHISAAQRWRDRAEEVLVKAENIHDPDARRVMLEIAAGYQRLAQRADKQSGDVQ